MKVTLNGLRYDTETATPIASARYHGPATDPEYWHEILYRTPRAGHWFLWGEGGPASKHAYRERPWAWYAGERIYDLSPEGARQWAEDNMDDETFSEHFGD